MVFFVGFNKSATTTIAGAFETLGCKSSHNPSWAWRTYIPGRIAQLGSADVHTDGEMPFFPALLRHFPEAVVVYQYRSVGDWLLSRAVHVESNGRRSGGTPWLDNSREAIRTWIARRVWYEGQVQLEPRVHRVHVGEVDWIKRVGDICGVDLGNPSMRNARTVRDSPNIRMLRLRVEAVLSEVHLGWEEPWISRTGGTS